MKNVVQKTMTTLALIVAMMTAGAGVQAQVNMSRYITLTVWGGEHIALSLQAAADNTPVRIVSGSITWNITVGTSKTRKYCLSDGTTMTIYGDITGFDCNGNSNKIVSIDVNNNTELKILNCSNNQLTSLDVSGCTALTTLDCRLNKLTSLDVSNNTALKILNCWDNQQLTTLDVSSCPVLDWLYFGNNPQLKTLNISGCSSLRTTMDFQDFSKIEVIKASGCSSLTELYCSKKPVKELDLTGCSSLKKLKCKQTKLQTLKLEGCKALEELDCAENPFLTSPLDVSGSYNLKKLYCHSTGIPSINVSGLNKLTKLDFSYSDNLTSINADYCRSLTSLYCGNSPYLYNIRLYDCTALKTVDCAENRLTACMLDQLFRDLPKRQPGDGAEIYIGLNQGYRNCRTPIAKDKNWKVMEWKGGNEIVNTNFTCKDYGFSICGKRIYEDINHLIDNGLFDSSEVSGSVSYDPATKTLSLENGWIVSQHEDVDALVNFDNEGMIIKVKGSNCVIGVEQQIAYGDGLFMGKHTIIEGSGGKDVLYIPVNSGDEGISAYDDANLTVRKGVYVKTDKISGSGGLTVDNATLETYSSSSIKDIAFLTLKGTAITQPAGARFDKGKKAIVDAKGNVATGVKIEPGTSALPATLTDAGIIVRGERGVLYVEKSPGATATQVAVYEISGMLAGNYRLNANTTAIHLPAGFYTVVAANAVSKVIVK